MSILVKMSDIEDPFSIFDVLLIKLSENGEEEWSQTFGNNTNEVAYDVEQNKQLEYIIAGYALIDKKEKIYNSFIIKTDSIGNVVKRLDFNEEQSNQLYDINIKYNDTTKTESYIGTGNIFNEYGKRSFLELKLLEYINRSIVVLNRVQSIIDINGPYMFDDSNDEDERPETIEETMESMSLQ